MVETKIILLNAPINSGKDYIADLLVKHLGANKLQFKDQLYKDVAEYFALPLDLVIKLATCRREKEQPNVLFSKSSAELYDLSPRQAMIHVSEVIMKPLYGSDRYGKSASHKLLEGINVVSDSGFKEEAKVLVDIVGVSNVHLVHIYKDECSFGSNDSRGYIELEGITPIKFYNNTTCNNEEDEIQLVHSLLDMIGIKNEWHMKSRLELLEKVSETADNKYSEV